MKPEYIYERRQTANRMESVMLVASVAGAITALLALFQYGWLPSLTLFLLSLVAFALSRVLDLIADLFTSIGKIEESIKPPDAEKAGKAS